MKGKRIVPKRLFAFCGRPMGVKPPNRFAVSTISQSRHSIAIKRNTAIYNWPMRNGLYGDENNSNAKAASIVTKECQDLALQIIG